jgi:hypothetical protein
VGSDRRSAAIMDLRRLFAGFQKRFKLNAVSEYIEGERSTRCPAEPNSENPTRRIMCVCVCVCVCVRARACMWAGIHMCIQYIYIYIHINI